MPALSVRAFQGLHELLRYPWTGVVLTLGLISFLWVLLVVIILARDERRLRQGQSSLVARPTSTRAGDAGARSGLRRAVVNGVFCLLVLTTYLYADPLGTRFRSTSVGELLTAEHCITRGECPAVGPSVSDTSLRLGPLYYYVLIPGVLVGYGSLWVTFLGMLAFASSVVLLICIGDRMFGYPAGMVSALIWSVLVGIEFLADLRHAPLAAPFAVALFWNLWVFRRDPRIRTYVAICLLFWIGLQFQFSLCVFVPLILWILVTTTRGTRLALLLSLFLAFGVVLQLSTWVSYAAGGFAVFAETMTAAARIPSSLARFGFLLALPFAAALLLVRWVGRESDETPDRQPVLSVWFLVAVFLGYLPFAGHIEPRYLFPFATAVALTIASHLLALLGATPRPRRTAGLALSLIAMALAPHLVWSYFVLHVGTRYTTLRGQMAMADRLWEALGTEPGPTPQIHGSIPIDVSEVVEYLLHERARREGREGSWGVDGPCAAIEGAANEGSAGSDSGTEYAYRPCLQYSTADVALTRDGAAIEHLRGIRLPLGGGSLGRPLKGGQKTEIGIRAAEAIDRHIHESEGRAGLELSFARGRTAGCAESEKGEVRVVVDGCAVVSVRGCDVAGTCAEEEIELDPRLAPFGVGTKVRRLSVPAGVVAANDRLHVSLQLDQCGGKLSLLDVYEVVDAAASLSQMHRQPLGDEAVTVGGQVNVVPPHETRVEDIVTIEIGVQVPHGNIELLRDTAHGRVLLQ